MIAEPFVHREFSIDPETGQFSVDPAQHSTRLTLIFQRPVASDHHWYRCAYEIHANGSVVREFGVLGIDAVNALVRAMSSAVSDLELRFASWYSAIPAAYLDDMRT